MTSLVPRPREAAINNKLTSFYKNICSQSFHAYLRLLLDLRLRPRDGASGANADEILLHGFTMVTYYEHVHYCFIQPRKIPDFFWY